MKKSFVFTAFLALLLSIRNDSHTQKVIAYYPFNGNANDELSAGK
ncbi:hypothetical protein [Thermaurantimonas aggregans]|nr:hypothetical protein [Thermaurantimonas aggregans]MCX8149484.1 hypothetical protein [Thermaurantimonas aggregans]